MIELVSVNGILQSKHEYVVQDTCIIFHTAPQPLANICVNIKGSMVTYTGNGTNCVFSIPLELRDEFEFKQFMENVWKHRDNSTVKDQLEKLKIVMELVR